MSADALQREPFLYISSSKEYNIQPKPLFSAFEFRALAILTVRSLLMSYMPLLEPKTASEDDDNFLNEAAEEPRPDLIVPLKKSAKQIAREVGISTDLSLVVSSIREVEIEQYASKFGSYPR